MLRDRANAGTAGWLRGDRKRRRGPIATFWRGFKVAAFIVVLLSAGHAAAQPLQRLEIITSSGLHAFDVELADTPEKWAKGLMFRRSMAPDQGMLFDFHAERLVSMWMKDTYISLDMVFVGRDGVVNRIEARAAPLSLQSIAGGIAYAAIELNAGVAERIGLKPGDVVRHPAFGRDEGGAR